MNPAITVAVITACVTALGWLVTNHFSDLRDQQKAKAEATLQFVERQLEELYGPLVALMYEGRQIFADLLDSLGRDHVFFGDRHLPPEELAAWLFWAENSFLPRNKQIRDLLVSKTHLVEGKKFPESYVQFFLHESSWRLRHDRWLKEKVAYNWRSCVNWPVQFEKDVIKTFEYLKDKHCELLGVLHTQRREDSQKSRKLPPMM